MTIYAIPESVPAECTYLTAGKRYEVTWENEKLFQMVSDLGLTLYPDWKGSGFLNGANWTRVVEGEESEDELIQLVAAAIANAKPARSIPQAKAVVAALASRTPTEPLECAPGYHRRPPDRQGESAVEAVARYVETWCYEPDGRTIRENICCVETACDIANSMRRQFPHPAPSSGGKGDAALREALEEAKLQLEYLDKRHPTGTTPAVIGRIEAALSEAQAGGGE